MEQLALLAALIRFGKRIMRSGFNILLTIALLLFIYWIVWHKLGLSTYANIISEYIADFLSFIKSLA